MWLERKGLNGQRRKTMIVKLIIDLNVFDILHLSASLLRLLGTNWI